MFKTKWIGLSILFIGTACFKPFCSDIFEGATFLKVVRVGKRTFTIQKENGSTEHKKSHILIHTFKWSDHIRILILFLDRIFIKKKRVLLPLNNSKALKILKC